MQGGGGRQQLAKVQPQTARVAPHLTAMTTTTGRFAARVCHVVALIGRWSGAAVGFGAVVLNGVDLTFHTLI